MEQWAIAREMRERILARFAYEGIEIPIPQRMVWHRDEPAAVADDPDFEYVILDATIVRAHQHSAGGKGGLKLRPSVAPAVASRPSCTSPSMPSATLCVSCSPLGRARR